MSFEIGELAIINENAIIGLPDRIGEVVEIVSQAFSPNYNYYVQLDNGDFVPVREKELDKLTEEQLQLMAYIKRENKVVYSPLNEEVVIKKIDLIHGHIEVEFEGNALAVVTIEQLKPIEDKGEDKVIDKFKVGDKVRAITSDHYNGRTGIIESISEHKDDKYRVRHESGAAFFYEEELELLSKQENEKELHFDLLFGHFENEDGTFTVPRQLLHNLLNKVL